MIREDKYKKTKQKNILGWKIAEQSQLRICKGDFKWLLKSSFCSGSF